MTFDDFCQFHDLCQKEPRLAALYFETQFIAGKVSRIAGTPGRGCTKPNHCKMMEWHGVPQERGQIGMKWFLQKIAADNPLVAQHWDLCYHTLHDALPAWQPRRRVPLRFSGATCKPRIAGCRMGNW